MKKERVLLYQLSLGKNIETINGLSSRTINGKKELLEAYNKFWDSVPKLENFYSNLLLEINNKQRTHCQSTFGDIEDFDPTKNVCGSQMCTAGHLVNVAGERGYELKKEFGFATSAEFIHKKSYPDAPCQDFGNIPQSWAISYIEIMAEFDERKDKEQTFNDWINYKL